MYLALLLMLVLWAGDARGQAGDPDGAEPADAGGDGVVDPTALVLDVQGPIGPATRDFITRSLEQAAERDAAIVIIRLDTPGGLDASTRDIIKAILASEVPVATYVAPAGARAASAGAYILLASQPTSARPRPSPSSVVRPPRDETRRAKDMTGRKTMKTRGEVAPKARRIVLQTTR